jgi:hypothetical protein
MASVEGNHSSLFKPNLHTGRELQGSLKKGRKRLRIKSSRPPIGRSNLDPFQWIGALRAHCLNSAEIVKRAYPNLTASDDLVRTIRRSVFVKVRIVHSRTGGDAYFGLNGISPEVVEMNARSAINVLLT